MGWDELVSHRDSGEHILIQLGQRMGDWWLSHDTPFRETNRLANSGDDLRWNSCHLAMRVIYWTGGGGADSFGS